MGDVSLNWPDDDSAASTRMHVLKGNVQTVGSNSLPVFCSVHDTFGAFLAIGIVEEIEDTHLLRVTRMRPARALEVSLTRWGQREFVLRLSGGIQFSALAQSPTMVQVTRSCDFLILGLDKAARTQAQSVALRRSE
jgi:hypothetical protein